jgi:hypothetical protein
MFHLDVSKIERVLHMLQWHRWLADNDLPAAAGLRLLPRAFLARHASPSPLFSLPSFPSLHLATTVRARARNSGVRTAPCVGGRHGKGESSGQCGIQADRAHNMEQEGETQSSRGRQDAGVRPNVPALALPLTIWKIACLAGSLAYYA